MEIELNTLNRSIDGVRKEIFERQNLINHVKRAILNRQFYPKNPYDQVSEALRMHREVKRLKVIKAELMLILVLQHG